MTATPLFSLAFSLGWILIFLAISFLQPSALAAETPEKNSRVRVEIEGAAAWVSRNDVQIPHNEDGTRFSLAELVGEGPFPAWRTLVEWDPWERHGFKILLAPFEYDEAGSYDKDITFQGQTYQAGRPVETFFRFNSYRFGYRYTFFTDERWSVRGGATAKIRHAKIRVRSGDTTSEKTDVGLVPLLALRADYHIDEDWQAIFDADFLAAPQGRAIDTALLFRYLIDRDWDISMGYRLLDGGADNDEVFTFAQVHYALVQLGFRF